MKHKTIERIGLTLILATAAAIRLSGLNNISPPGLEHDEVAHWLINRDILAGQHAIYFTEAYGHEAGYHYWQTLFMALLGDHALSLRLPSAFLGLLLVATSYQLVRVMFGRTVALPATAVHALLFMPVFYSRLGLRAIALPVVASLSAYFWWRWWQRQERQPTRGGVSWELATAALFAGLATHTYMASRALPIFYALFVGYLALTHWPTMKERWPALGLFAAVYLLISLPLILFLRQVPNAEVRISEVDAPLRALLAGNMGPIWHNFWAILLGFGVQGDPLWRQNVAGLPLFDPLLGAAFYVGLVLLIGQWRDPRRMFTLLWVGCALIPSLVTVDAPSNIRMIGFLPLLAVPAILLLIHINNRLSTVFPQLSTDLWINWWITGLTLLILLFHGGRTAQNIFSIWPSNENEVRFVWQSALTGMAGYLDAHPEITQAAVGGWTPDTMDNPTMFLTLRRQQMPLRHYGQVGELQTIIIPNPATGPTAVLRPTVLPLNGWLAEQITQWAGAEQHSAEFSYFVVPQNEVVPAPQYLLTADFGGELQLLGYDSHLLPPFDQLEIVTYWRVLAPPTAERRFFLHMVDRNTGELLGQHDALAAPATFWQPGDLILQYHTLPNQTIAYELQLGVYEPQPPWSRLPTAAGADFVALQP